MWLLLWELTQQVTSEEMAHAQEVIWLYKGMCQLRQAIMACGNLGGLTAWCQHAVQAPQVGSRWHASYS